MTVPVPASPPVTLTRVIGRWSLAALTVNCVVGAGILGLPGRVFALAGPMTGWVLGAAALLALAVAFCLADLAGRFEAPGGPVEYCRAAFGAAAGFVVGWLLWTATVLAGASLLNLLVDLTGVAAHLRAGVIVAAGVSLTLFAMLGAGRSAGASAVLTVVKLGLLALVALAGLVAPPAPAVMPPGPFHPAQALVLLFFAFVGFERPTAVAGETVDAPRAVPFALLTGMAGVTILYAALFAACQRGVPDLAGSATPVADLAVRLAGPGGGRATAVGSIVIVVGTLASQWITAPRLLLAMAVDGTVPAVFARLSPRRRTPDLAILATGAGAMGLALGGSFVAGIAASSASRLLIFLICAAAILRLRTPSRFRLPARRLIAAIVLSACTVLLVSVGAELGRLAPMLLLGGLIWFSTTRMRPRSRLA